MSVPTPPPGYAPRPKPRSLTAGIAGLALAPLLFALGACLGLAQPSTNGAVLTITPVVVLLWVIAGFMAFGAAASLADSLPTHLA